MKYKIIDMQSYQVIPNLSDKDVKQYAWDIVKNRVDAIPDDELGIKFSEILENGFNNFLLDKAISILSDWEYQAVQDIQLP